jgi:serine/threonine-protein kinase
VSARFVREARAASRVHHPGIVDVIDFGSLPDGRAFLVMERIDGETLEQIIDGSGAMDPARAVTIARRIATALDAAHGAGVVHRDLKPSNVFVLADDAIKLADFGAAKMIDSTSPAETQKGQIFGTPYYMSPEHARGLATDRRTDVYSLGCVLYEMLTGTVPFDGPTVMDILTKHIMEPLSPMQTMVPIPDVLERTVSRALAKRVEERYQTAAEMGADLDRAAAALGRTGWRRWLPT